MSVAKTMVRIQEAYVWPGMRAEVRRHIDKCGQCLVHTSRPVHVQMGEMPYAAYPGAIARIDLIGPFLPSPDGCNYILTCIDHGSGWAEAYPIKGKSNKQVWDK